jgi:hypothetical protein
VFVYFHDLTSDRLVVVSPGSSASTTNKTYPHDITEIVSKVMLNTINQIINHYYYMWTLQLSSHFPDPYGISKNILKIPKGQPRSRKLIEDRQCNYQAKTDKGTNNDLQNTTQKKKSSNTKYFNLYLIQYLTGSLLNTRGWCNNMLRSPSCTEVLYLSYSIIHRKSIKLGEFCYVYNMLTSTVCPDFLCLSCPLPFFMNLF